MSRYYFAVASLPMLFYGTDTGPDREGFLQLCLENCSAKDFMIIESADLEPGERKNDLLRRWSSWETSLRNELTTLRAKDLKKDPSRYLRDEMNFFTDVSDIAREAYNQESPLLAEEVLNQARWNRLEELETGHHFDLEKLIVYHLKLQLNERKALFTKKAGEEKFTRIYESIKEPANSREPVAGEYR